MFFWGGGGGGWGGGGRWGKEGEGEGLGFSRHTKVDKKVNYGYFFSNGHKIHVNTEYYPRQRARSAILTS